MKRPAPYSVGFNGHAYCCDCLPCARMRAKRVTDYTQVPFLGGDVTPEKTVFVRAHFRRGKNHLSRFPNTHRLVKAALVRAQRRAA